MNTGNYPKVCAWKNLRIVNIFIVLRSSLDTSQSTEKKSLTSKGGINLRIKIMCALHFKHGFKPTSRAVFAIMFTSRGHETVQAQVWGGLWEPAGKTPGPTLIISSEPKASSFAVWLHQVPVQLGTLQMCPISLEVVLRDWQRSQAL